MNRPTWLGGHGRWEKDLHAYTDGTLRGDGRSAFVRHMETCDECRTASAELEAMRTVLRTMPDRAAPRSFRITPEMAAEVKRQPERGGSHGFVPAPVMTPSYVRPPAPVFALRFAQATAAVAVLGLAAVLVADFGGVGTGNDSSATFASEDADMQRTTMGTAESAGAGADAAGAPASSDAGGSGDGSEPNDTVDDGALPLPDTEDGVGGASANGETPTAEPRPEPPMTGADSDDVNRQADISDPIVPSDAPGEAETTLISGTEVAPSAADSGDNATRSTLRAFEAVLGIVAVGAIVLAFFASRSIRSRA